AGVWPAEGALGSRDQVPAPAAETFSDEADDSMVDNVSDDDLVGMRSARGHAAGSRMADARYDLGDTGHGHVWAGRGHRGLCRPRDEARSRAETVTRRRRAEESRGGGAPFGQQPPGRAKRGKCIHGGIAGYRLSGLL